MKHLPWTVIFAGISAAAGVAYVVRSKGQSGAPSVNIIPALNGAAMAGPSVPGYNSEQLTLPNQTAIQSIPASQPVPNYLTSNQGPNRVARKLHQWTQRARPSKHGSCCDPCATQSAASSGAGNPPSQTDQLYNLYGINSNTTNYTWTADATLL
jgi:hypothetical protein